MDYTKCKSCGNSRNLICSYCEENDRYRKTTNADRIREMSDNELAGFLYETETQYAPCDLGIEDTWLEWLQQEVE